MNKDSSGLSSTSPLDRICINALRFLSVDAIQQARSGHPGLPLGAAPMAYVLWTRFLKHNPANPEWWDRDRFVLSAGHGSMLLYSLLYLTGYDLSLDEIRRFRQWGSRTPGHPECRLVPGVEVTTGPLGQGFANAVGMAIAESYQAARYNRPGRVMVNHHTYILAGDGDLMEGVAYEAASMAGHLKLGKLICLYDDNRISLAGATDLSFSEDRMGRFEALGWHAIAVQDGNDVDSLAAAIQAAKDESGHPSIIMVRTHIGFGSPNKQDSHEAHGAPLGVEEVLLTKKNLGWPADPPFYVPDEALNHFRQAIRAGRKWEAEWNEQVAAYSAEFPDAAREFLQLMRGELPDGWAADLPSFAADEKGMATRAASAKAMEAISPKLAALIGGSADLNPSTKSALKNAGDFQNPDSKPADVQGMVGGGWGYHGRNLHFGVREHAMGAIANGMAAHGGLIPYCATFFVFSDYMRAPIRLAALMELGVIYVFTHDSIGVGEDGPTHQPVEHLAALRAIPGLIAIRPADANETVTAWRFAVENRRVPVALILSRQSVPTLDRARYASAAGLTQGAYVLADTPGGDLQLILIASGSEVALIVAAQRRLLEKGISSRAVSMPSWELFDAQPRQYRDSVLPPSIRARLAVEAGVCQGWHKYVGDEGDVMGLDRFGASAPSEIVFEKFGYTIENVVERALSVLDRAKGREAKS